MSFSGERQVERSRGTKGKGKGRVASKPKTPGKSHIHLFSPDYVELSSRLLFRSTPISTSSYKTVTIGTPKRRRLNIDTPAPSSARRLTMIHRMQSLRAEAELLEREMACLRSEFEDFVSLDEDKEAESEDIDED
jgi:hypothetical protein